MADPIEIIDTPKLLSYLGLSADAAPPGTDTRVELTNGLISEAWANPETPIPTWVTLIALEVAGRPTRNPKGLVSWTRAVDDASRTERLSEKAAKAGIFLTADERNQLVNGQNTEPRRRRYGTVRTRPGY